MSGVSEITKKYIGKIEKTLDGKEQFYRNFVDFMIDSSIKTKYHYLFHVCNFMKSVDKKPEDLEFDDFNNYMAKTMYKEDGTERTSSYRITIYSALKKFNEYLFTSGKLDQNYMLYIKRPKPKESQLTIEKREEGFLTEKEIKEFIECIKSDIYINDDFWSRRNLAIAMLFITTGIRNSALCMLDLDDVDLEKGTMIVTEKGENVKVYNLSEEVCFAIHTWLIFREDIMFDWENNKVIPGNSLFVSKQKTRLTIQGVNCIIKKYAKQITDKPITPHKLRATYGTQLYNKTKDIYFVQQCMGHANPKTTELYVREKKQNTKKASDIMSKLL